MCGHPTSLTELVTRAALLNPDPKQRMGLATLLERLEAGRGEDAPASPSMPGAQPEAGSAPDASLPPSSASTRPPGSDVPASSDGGASNAQTRVDIAPQMPPRPGRRPKRVL